LAEETGDNAEGGEGSSTKKKKKKKKKGGGKNTIVPAPRKLVSASPRIAILHATASKIPKTKAHCRGVEGFTDYYVAHEQTEPPTIPVEQLFEPGKFPIGISSGCVFSLLSCA
jgi:methionyl aminopeptidase